MLISLDWLKTVCRYKRRYTSIRKCLNNDRARGRSY